MIAPFGRLAQVPANFAGLYQSKTVEALVPFGQIPLLREVIFDASKFQWLGSVTPRPAVISVWHSAPATLVPPEEHHRLVEAAYATI